MQAWQRTSLPLFAVSAQSNTSRKDEAATSTVAQDTIFHKLQDPYIVNAAQSGVILLNPTTHLATVGSWTQIKRKNIKIVYRYDKSWIHGMFCHDGKWKVHMCTLSLTVRRLRFLTLKLERYVLSQSCNHHMEKQRRYFPCELNFAVPSCL